MVLVSGGGGAGAYRQAAQEDFSYRRETLISFEGKYQFLYFFVSGIVASAILVLIYISMEGGRVPEIKAFQGKLQFVKSNMEWCFNNSWQFVGDPNQRQQVYSAYFDIRPDILKNVRFEETHIPYGSLRIFGVFPLKLKGQIACIVRFDDYSTVDVPAAEAVPIDDHHECPFAAYTIMCPLEVRKSSNTILLPRSVAIVYTANLQSHLKPTFVPISYPKNIDRLREKTQPRLAICVGPPLQKQYNQAPLQLVEFIEIYQILGASKFHFYLQSASNEVIEVLNYYVRQNIVELHNWNLHPLDGQIWSDASLANLNDCAFRVGIVDGYRYAAIVDMDEILVPLRHNSLMDYLRKIDEGRTSAFIFRNVFFYKKDSNDLFSVPPLIRNTFLYTQVKVRRTLEVFPPHVRSKYIINTRSVIELSNHYVWRTVTGYTETNVHVHVGLLFQYRDKCIGCKNVLITDYTARRFGSLLWERVDFTCQTIFADRGGLCPLE